MNTTIGIAQSDRQQIVNVSKKGETMAKQPNQHFTKTLDGLRPAHQPKSTVMPSSILNVLARAAHRQYVNAARLMEGQSFRAYYASIA